MRPHFLLGEKQIEQGDSSNGGNFQCDKLGGSQVATKVSRHRCLADANHGGEGDLGNIVFGQVFSELVHFLIHPARILTPTKGNVKNFLHYL